jgi:hypothetical protein
MNAGTDQLSAAAPAGAANTTASAASTVANPQIHLVGVRRCRI